MSKYRIEISPSRVQPAVGMLLGLALVVSVFSWQPYVLAYQGWIQAALTLVIVVVLALSWRRQRKQQVITVAISDKGYWLQSGDEENDAKRISSASRVTGWLLWVGLTPALDQSRQSTTEWTLLFRDQLSDEDYRRLSRILLQRQAETS